MKTTLTVTAVALLSGIAFAAAQTPDTPQQVQHPDQSGQQIERNPSGAVGGSQSHPSPTGMPDRISGPRAHQPLTTGQQEERNPSGKVGGSKRHPSPTTGSSMVRGPKAHQPSESGQKEERNPSGSTGGSENHPSPR